MNKSRITGMLVANNASTHRPDDRLIEQKRNILYASTTIKKPKGRSTNDKSELENLFDHGIRSLSRCRS